MSIFFLPFHRIDALRVTLPVSLSLSWKFYETRPNKLSSFAILFLFHPCNITVCVRYATKGHFDPLTVINWPLDTCHLAISFNLTVSLHDPPRSVTSSYLLFTSTRRACFRTWLLVKLVSVTKVMNENIDGYGFSSPLPFIRSGMRKRIFRPSSLSIELVIFLMHTFSILHTHTCARVCVCMYLIIR